MSAIDNINREFFAVRPPAQVLDIGSADGTNAIALKHIGYSVSTIEIDPTLVARLKARPESAGLHITQGDATRMPYPNSSFDAAVLLEVIEHVPNTPGLLTEISRVLKPGGTLCIGVPTAYTERVYSTLHPRYSTNATHVHVFEREALVAALTQARLSVTHIEPRNFLPAVSWLFHALLRSESDHTGTIHEHRGIDKVLGKLFRVWTHTPVLNRALFWLERRVGKSWYVYAVSKKDTHI